MTNSTASDLPTGTIVHRVIRGKDRFYHQWRENGVTKSRYLKRNEIGPLREQLELRKRLKSSGQRGTVPFKMGSVPLSEGDAAGRLVRQAITGARLLEFAQPAVRFTPRFAFAEVRDFLLADDGNEVLLVNGPDGSGKTTLLRQLVLALSAEEREATVLLRPLDDDSEDEIARALTLFAERGVRRFLIDDATYTSTFGLSGVKVILTAALPLPALYGGETPLAMQLPVVDLSFIPYAEHVALLGDTSLVGYLETGGSLTPAPESPRAIRGLSLPLDRTLSGIEERLNLHFLQEVLASAAAAPRDSRRRQESFVGTDLSRLARRLAAEIGEPTEDDVRMREILLTVPVGLRFRHLRERILALIDDPVADHLGAAERKIVCDVLLAAARQRLFEDVVWHELSAFRTTGTTFVERLRFAPGAYGFVIADREDLTCELVTAVLADSRDDRQLRYLNDPQHLERIEHRYGIVTAREVVYLGRNARHGTGVAYRNAVDFLRRNAARQ